MSGPDDWFEPEEKPALETDTSGKKSLKDKLKERKAKAEPEPLPVAEPAEPETPQPGPEVARPDIPDESWVKAYAQGTDTP